MHLTSLEILSLHNNPIVNLPKHLYDHTDKPNAILAYLKERQLEMLTYKK